MPEMHGTELVREVARISPQTVSMLMTGGGVDSASIPNHVRVLKKPFLPADLFSAVEGALKRSAELCADLHSQVALSARTRSESASLRQQAELLRSESVRLQEQAKQLLSEAARLSDRAMQIFSEAAESEERLSDGEDDRDSPSRSGPTPDQI
jgi:response regulator RpfG family c-di-GMP phosphodiesterase